MLTVFLVDDEKLIRQGLKKMIDWSTLGYTVVGEASNGEEALNFLQNNHVDLIITDIRMPFMDGLSLSKEAKSISPNVQIIILTGYDDFEFLQKSIRLSIDDYLLKPITSSKLEEALNHCHIKLKASTYIYPLHIEKMFDNIIREDDHKLLQSTIHHLREFFKQEYFDLPHQFKVIQSLIYHFKKQIDILDMEIIDICLKDEEKYQDSEVLLKDFTRIIYQIMDIRRSNEQLTTLNDIKNYIDEEFSTDITLESLSEMFFFSPSYISQLFSNSGESYISYLTKVRINHAKTLLIDSTIPIVEISFLCGYNNSKYFSRIFKKLSGYMPSEYRKLFNDK